MLTWQQRPQQLVARYIKRHLQDAICPVAHAQRAMAARLLRRPLQRKNTLAEFTSYSDDVVLSSNGRSEANNNNGEEGLESNARRRSALS